VDCDVLADGEVAVTTPERRFRISEIADAVARITIPAAPGDRAPRVTQRLVALPVDLPPPSSLDAPDPTDAPAWAAREEDTEPILLAIEERSAELLTAASPEAACAAGLDLLMGYVPAEAAAVLVVDRGTRDLRFVAARGPRSRGLAGLPVPADRGIAGLVLRTGIATIVREVARDPRHNPDVDARTGYRTRALLCVPIRGQRRTLGCVELLNPFAGLAFAAWHQSATQLVAARLAAVWDARDPGR
jgi:hypothetical protein